MPHVIVLKDHPQPHYFTKYEGKTQFSNFSMNWGKFGNVIQAFQESQFPISFMNWEKLGNIRSPKPTFQNPNVESMDELGKLMS